MSLSPPPMAAAAFFADALDLDLLEQLHRRHSLFLAWPEDGAEAADARGPAPITLTLDGDAAAMVTELLRRARFATLIRAEAARQPNRRIASAIRELDALQAAREARR